MREFKYTYADIKNIPKNKKRDQIKIFKKTINASNLKEAERKLLDEGIAVIDIKEERGKQKKNEQKTIKLKNGDIAKFAEQMQLTQEIQMNVVPALRLCSRSLGDKRIKKVCNTLADEIELKGVALHEAMDKSKAFNEMVVGMVKAGELGGFLESSLREIKEICERNETIKRKLRSVMIYPAITIIIAIIAIYALMLKTVPVFVGLYAEAGAALPIPTQILVSVSNLVTSHPILIAIACIAAIYGVIKVPALYARSRIVQRLILRIPVVSSILRKSIVATFCKTLANMSAAQGSLLESLLYCRSVSVNHVYRYYVAKAVIKVSRGGMLYKSLEEGMEIFGEPVVRAVEFGENTGKMDEIVRPLALGLDRELGEYVDNIKVVMEPLLTLVIGGITLLIMLALFIPVFSMSKLL